MTWVRLDDGMPLHPKILALSDGAFRLWICGLAFANRAVTDGLIPARLVPTLDHRRAWTAPQITRFTAELQAAGLWSEPDPSTGAHAIHGYAEYQEEALKESVEARREGARERKRRQRKRQKLLESGDGHAVTPRDIERDRERDTARDASGTEPRERSRDSRVPDGDAQPPLSQPPVPSRPVPSEKKRSLPPRRDPLATATDLPGVAEVHAAWKASCNFPNHRFRNAYDVDAITIADAISAYGLPDCLTVANHAPSDGMVTGKADEGKRHDSISYIFGNANAFNRILRAANEAAGKSSRKRSARELVEEARRL